MCDRDVEQHIDPRDKTGYRVGTPARNIRMLATRADRAEVFETVLERVQAEHRLERTLMSILEAANSD